MKRVTYISNFSRPLSAEELETIGRVSVANNRRDHLTGVLLCFQGIFFQILEGDDAAVDRTYQRIQADDRHANIFLVNMETSIRERLYPDWEMKLVVLDESNDDLVRSVRSLLGSVTRTHRILEKYAPLTILRRIQEGIDPLSLSFRYVERTVIFSDIFASTTLTEHLGPGEVSSLLDDYYRITLGAIKRTNGVVSKLTGDGLMAYWPADATDQALTACVESLRELASYRALSKGRIGRLLYAGFGVASGRVLEGNIGSNVKKDYTLLGDTVNKAARLEGVTRRVQHGLVLDESVRPHMGTAYTALRLGRYRPKGKTQLLEIYTLEEPAVKLVLPEGGLQSEILRSGLAAAS